MRIRENPWKCKGVVKTVHEDAWKSKENRWDSMQPGELKAKRERERDGLGSGFTLEEKGLYKDGDSYMSIESLKKEKPS